MVKQGGTITKDFMILNDYDANAGRAKGHYFHQDLLVAKFINESNPDDMLILVLGLMDL